MQEQIDAARLKIAEKANEVGQRTRFLEQCYLQADNPMLKLADTRLSWRHGIELHRPEC